MFSQVVKFNKQIFKQNHAKVKVNETKTGQYSRLKMKTNIMS